MADPSTYFIRAEYAQRDERARPLTTLSASAVRNDEFALAQYLAKRLGRTDQVVVDAATTEAMLRKGADAAAKSLPDKRCAATLMVLSEVFEKASDPTELARYLANIVARGAVAIVTTSDRESSDGPDHPGPPSNERNLREWSLPEFRSLLDWAGLPTDFVGRIARNDRHPEKNRIIAILDSNARRPETSTPPDFKVRAIMACYNEADIIQPTIEYLAEQGVETHLLDNWSTDGTYELAQQMRGHGLVELERIPSEGDAGTFTYRGILSRVEQLARSSKCDWIVRHDVDERRSSPWPGITLRDALFHVQALGFNSIDHTVLDFSPVDDSFHPGGDPETALLHFSFGKKAGSFVQVKGWKTTDQSLHLHESAGHGVRFNGQRIFPYKFLLKHYPIRSQEHGMRKVMQDRAPRWDPEARAKGWHTHYDHVESNHNFLQEASELLEFDITFYEEYLVERIAGVGALRTGQSSRV